MQFVFYKQAVETRSGNIFLFSEPDTSVRSSLGGSGLTSRICIIPATHTACLSTVLLHPTLIGDTITVLCPRITFIIIVDIMALV